MAEQRLIDANALDTRERGNNSQRVMWWEIRKIINEAPTIEAKPVVHAYWAIFGKDGTDTDYGCTNCGYTFTTSGSYPQSVHYCPYCGAQMDESISCSHEDDMKGE